MFIYLTKNFILVAAIAGQTETMMLPEHFTFFFSAQACSFTFALEGHNQRSSEQVEQTHINPPFNQDYREQSSNI